MTVDRHARQLLARYGVVYRELVVKEITLPWRELLVHLRRLEARGELRGGRFVAGVVGEQFAVPEAVDALRAVRRVTTDADVANACLFFASDVSRQITGADLPVDGGWAAL